MPDCDTVIFDLGGVLIDWNPRHLYRKVFTDEAEMEAFLSTVCTPAWNGLQDEGRTVAEAVEEAAARHPDKRALIEAFYGRFDEMMAGAIEDTVEVLGALDAAGVPLFALTNWCAETFPMARRRFAFLDRFQDILVSGEEKLRKPDRRIYEMAISRFGVAPERTVFIDDSPANITAATDAGLTGIHFDRGGDLRAALTTLGLL